MTEAPCRALRNQVDDCRTRPLLTQRERNRHAYILEAGEKIFIAHGRAAVTLKQFSRAVGLTQFTIHKHISCLDHLFAIILTNHLDQILAAIDAVSYTVPDRLARRRAEYFRVTRGIGDFPTPMHFLLLRDRFCLPPDELKPIDRLHHVIGSMLGGENPEEVLALLDCPTMNLKKIESVCAHIDGIDRDLRENPPPPPNFAHLAQPAAEPPKTEPRLAPAMASPPLPPDAMANLSDDMLQALTTRKPPETKAASMASASAYATNAQPPALPPPKPPP